MRIIILWVLVIFSSFSFADGLEILAQNIKAGNISVQDIESLVELDRVGQKIGYGLCLASVGAPTSQCNQDGTVGYGMCVIAVGAPTSQCDSSGSIGYGLCVLSVGAPTSQCAK